MAPTDLLLLSGSVYEFSTERIRGSRFGKLVRVSHVAHSCNDSKI